MDYSYTTNHATKVLPMPLDTDSLDDIAAKMEALADVVEQRRSLLAATGFRGAELGDPAAAAVATMCWEEALDYDAWRRGEAVPVFDWERNRIRVSGEDCAPVGERTRRELERRARAMNAVWRVHAATPENALWLAVHMSNMEPLVEAVAKVQAEEAIFVRRVAGLVGDEVEEMRLAGEIISVGSSRLQEVCASVRRLYRRIHRSRAVLRSRERAVRAKLARYQRCQGRTVACDGRFGAAASDVQSMSTGDSE
ncbi:hypothetical protein N3K66_007001 [Trichothecium roseum]|uniref:Uncharacterized protein n=1 Tax=Trichothecium roseum TaxID=47278 RepID=A0ACC0UWY2_9HYPO|nr:hypothetical protein N3K66_007001 [Trichothecium roseum]